MARRLWSGTLSFGLVAVPVQLVSAVRDRDIRFHEIDEKTGEPVKVRRTCENGKKEVAWEEIGHGYELDGKQVVLSDEDLAAAAPERTRTIEIEEFVKLEEIDPAHFNHPYFLVPDSDSEGVLRAYRLLRDAIGNTGRVAIGRVVLRSKEYLVAVREREDLLSLTTMLFADEIRDPREIDAVPSGNAGKPGRGEVAQALKVIDAMSRDFDPSRYEDCHRSRLMKLIQKKRRTGEVEMPELEAEPTPVPDLMAALKESLARARRA
ncbi:MAG TPA: Ku protein [Solirubrobacteraceae bacterium]|jgi:DNA end-binding protein Ku|nr:Ku protein [Solirubrobacteraceae bacterium]